MLQTRTGIRYDSCSDELDLYGMTSCHNLMASPYATNSKIHQTAGEKSPLKRRKTPFLTNPGLLLSLGNPKVIPNMYTLQSRVEAFNRCVSENQFAEALQNFYSEDLISVDNDGVPIRGKKPLLELVDQFMLNTSNLSTRVLNVMVSNNISVVERQYQFEYNKGGHFNYKQISIQQWSDGKIWHERHLYTL